jgi:Cu/Ag efflux protein CusF
MVHCIQTQNIIHLQQVGIQAQNIKVTKTMKKTKLQNTKKTCKHENIMPWNLKSPKVI